jgi:hypothetical protein
MATPRNYIGNTNKLISHQRREEEEKKKKTSPSIPPLRDPLSFQKVL